MELARNPSDKNISNWIAYNKKKSELNKRLQTRMREYLARNQKLTPEVNQILAQNRPKKDVTFDPSRFRVRMYFDSKCPHCKRMFNTLLDLQKRGVYVEALQIDDTKLSKLQYPIPIRPASKKEVKKQNISSVPYTLIADLKKKVLYPPVKGFQSVENMVNLIREGQ